MAESARKMRRRERRAAYVPHSSPPRVPGGGSASASGMPATGNTNYEWKPFDREHGAYATQVVEPMAAAILEWLMQQAEKPGSPLAFICEEFFAPGLNRWATAEARCLRLRSYLAEKGELEDGRERPALETLYKWEKVSAHYAQLFGLDPPSLARIRRDLAELTKEEGNLKVLEELRGKYAKRVSLGPQMGPHKAQEAIEGVRKAQERAGDC
jgi:hypothetical protein